MTHVRRSINATLLTALPASLCGACGDVAGRAALASARDSAGVTIVEYDARTLQVPDWSIGAEPLLRIGGAAATDAELYRVLAARRLSDGSVAVVNGGTHQLRIYGGDARLAAATGRAGDGPGEFRRLARVLQRVEDDTLVVYDAAARRVTYVSRDGRVARLVTIRADGRIPGTLSYVARLANGNHMLSSLTAASTIGEPDTIALLLYSAEGEYLAEFARFASGGSVVIDRGGGRVQRLPAPFAAEALTAATDDGVVVGLNGPYEFRLYSSDGALKSIRRYGADPRPLSAHHRATYPTEQFPGVVLPARVPFFDRLLIDSQACTWIRVDGVAEHEPQVWQIFAAADGKLVGRLVVPASLMLQDVGEDYIVATSRGEMDVEQVEIYPLVRR